MTAESKDLGKKCLNFNYFYEVLLQVCCFYTRSQIPYAWLSLNGTVKILENSWRSDLKRITGMSMYVTLPENHLQDRISRFSTIIHQFLRWQLWKQSVHSAWESAVLPCEGTWGAKHYCVMPPPKCLEQTACTCMHSVMPPTERDLFWDPRMQQILCSQDTQALNRDMKTTGSIRHRA